MPDLHEKFKTDLDLYKPDDMKVTADKVKTTMTLIKPKIVGVMCNYKKSGNRPGQRNEDNPDLGKFTLEKCVDGDDRAKFLPNRNKYCYLFCWCVALEEM